MKLWKRRNDDPPEAEIYFVCGWVDDNGTPFIEFHHDVYAYVDGNNIDLVSPHFEETFTLLPGCKAEITSKDGSFFSIDARAEAAKWFGIEDPLPNLTS